MWMLLDYVIAAHEVLSSDDWKQQVIWLNAAIGGALVVVIFPVSCSF